MTGIAGAEYLANHNIKSWDFDDDLNLKETVSIRNIKNSWQNYDQYGNPGTVVLAEGSSDQRTIAYSWHPGMNVPLTRTEDSVLSAGDKVTTWDFDNDYDSDPNESPTGLTSRVMEQGYTRNAAGQTVSYEYVTTLTYNTEGQVASVDGPVAGTDDTTYFQYDPADADLEWITRPLIGGTYYNSYDAAGQLGQITDVNDQIDTFKYDGRGRVKEIKHLADNSFKTIAYTTAGLAGTVTDEDGVYSVNTYKATYGRLDRITDMDGNYIAHGYDSQGNLIEKSKHKADDTRTSRKRWNYQHPIYPGLLYQEIKADNKFAEYHYHTDGTLASVKDYKLKSTFYEYDDLNRVFTVTQRRE